MEAYIERTCAHSHPLALAHILVFANPSLQARKAEAVAAGVDGMIKIYISALEFVEYFDNHWSHLAEDWCLGGRARAAAACGLATQQLPNTTNHAESWFSKVKNTELPLYVCCLFCILFFLVIFIMFSRLFFFRVGMRSKVGGCGRTS